MVDGGAPGQILISYEGGLLSSTVDGDASGPMSIDSDGDPLSSGGRSPGRSMSLKGGGGGGGRATLRGKCWSPRQSSSLEVDGEVSEHAMKEPRIGERCLTFVVEGGAPELAKIPSRSNECFLTLVVERREPKLAEI